MTHISKILSASIMRRFKRIAALAAVISLMVPAAGYTKQEVAKMANYREDIVSIDLENGNIHRSFLQHSIGEGDETANRFGVRAFRNGEPVNLSGSCMGLFIRADGATVTIADGVISGNTAYVTLPAACYAVEGNFSLAIKTTATGNVLTLRIVDGVVSRTSTNAVVDPGTIIPSIEDLIAAIEAAVESIPSDYSNLDSIAKIPSLYDLDHFQIGIHGKTMRNVFDSLTYKEDVNMSSTTFAESTLADYLTHTVESEGTKLYDAVRIRSDTGELLGTVKLNNSDITGTPNIAFGYRHDGTPDRVYKEADVVNHAFDFDSTTYFVIFPEYEDFSYEIVAETGRITDLMEEVNGITLDADVVGMPDLVIHANYNYGKSLSAANFYRSTIMDYRTRLTDSDITSISTPVLVRDESGAQITPIYCQYEDTLNQATIAYGFKADGTYDYIYKAADVDDGELVLNSTTYYLLIMLYDSVWMTMPSKFRYDDTVYHYEVGPGRQFTSFTACIRALTHDQREKVIDIYGGTYNVYQEIGGIDFINNIPSGAEWYDVSDIVPPNTSIIGHGIVELTMNLPDTIPEEKSVLLSPINVRGSCTIKNLRVTATNCRYCIHPEGSKRPRFNNARWIFEDLILNRLNQGAAIACGLNNGVFFKLKNCILISEGNGALSLHDQGIEYSQSPEVVVDGCVLQATYYAIVMASTKRTNMATVIDVHVINSYSGNLYMRKSSNSAADDTKDVFRAIYINTPHRSQVSSQLIDVIPDIEYTNFE